MHAVLDDVAKNGIPATHNEKAMRHGAEADLQQWDAYGSLLLEKQVLGVDGQSFAITIVNFFSLLHASYKMGGFYFQLLKKTFAEIGPPTRSRPYNLVVYSDECIPANPLASRTEKKVWACYATFREFTNKYISMEDAWLLLLVARSSIVHQAEGHMGQLMKIFLMEIFEAGPASPTELGVALQGPTKADDIKIFFRFSIFIQDGASQKLTYGIKGDSGNKFCLKCINQICLKGMSEDPDDDICLAKTKAELRLATNEEVFASFQRLANKSTTETAAAFKKWEQATGWIFTEHGLFGCQALKKHWSPITAYMHDWMHAMASNGVLNVVACKTLEDLSSSGLPCWQNMGVYTGLFVLPANHKSYKLDEIFSPTKVEAHRKAMKIKAPASEMLTLYPILRHYVLTIGKKTNCENPCKAFLATCHVLDLLLCTLHGTRKVDSAELDAAVESILHFCHASKWQDWMMKKFHWMLHFGDSLQQHSILIPCFNMERKHKKVTSVATQLQNLANYEKSIYTELLGNELYRLRTGQLPVTGLETYSRASKAVKNFVQEHFNTTVKEIYACTKVVLESGGIAARNDFVFVRSQQSKWDGGCIELNFAFDEGTFSVLTLYTLVEHAPNTMSATWQKTTQQCVIPSKHILAVAVYSNMKNGILTLVPFHLN